MTMKDEVKKSTVSKFITYIQINAELEKHLLYENILIPEFKRVEVTRFRTSSHRLKIETGGGVGSLEKDGYVIAVKK